MTPRLAVALAAISMGFALCACVPSRAASLRIGTMPAHRPVSARHNPPQTPANAAPSSPTGDSSQTRVVKVPIQIIHAKILHTVPPEYPPAARAKRIQGVVVLGGLVGTNGRAENLKLISGPSMLAGAAIHAVNQWLFQPATYDGVPHAVPWTFKLDFRLPAVVKQPPERVIQVSSQAMTARVLRQVPPIYPAEAARKGIHGKVVLRVLIGEDGHVKTLKPVSGNPILVKAAVAAVRRWVYAPTVIDGKPTAIHMIVTVAFALPKGQ